jgi:hypothetical protein
MLVGAAKMLYFSDAFVLGSRLLGLLDIGAGPLALAGWGAWTAWRGPGEAARTRALLLLAAAAIVFGWYAVFVSHTVGHARFTLRPLAWLTILLCGYGAFRWAARRAAAQGAT